MSDKEKKDKQVALLLSLGIHGALLVLFLFLVAWRAPDPPLPEYGIELNFGLDSQGSGEIQPPTPSGEEVTEESPLQEEPQKEQVKEELSEPQKVSEPVVSKQESPVVIKETKEPVKVPTEKAKVDNKTQKNTQQEQTKEAAKTAESKTSDVKKGDAQQSHGDDVAKQGDKGNPEGKLDANALYGKQGGGGGDGFALSMSGWAWASEPQIPQLTDNDDGRIVFEIECDENGEIVGILTLERGLSPKAEQLLKEEIRRNSLYRTSSGKVPERSKGKVVFLLKAK